MIKILRITLLGCIFLLNSCSMVGPVKAPQMNTYVINKIPEVAYRPGHEIIYVTPIDSAPLYNTNDMLYSTCKYKVDRFAKNRWAETPPRMLQTLIVQALHDTHHYRAVLSSPLNVRQNYVLETEIVKLQQNFIGTCHSDVEFVLRARLLNGSNRLVAAKEFSVKEPAIATPYGGVLAANHAVADVVARLAAFVTKY